MAVSVILRATGETGRGGGRATDRTASSTVAVTAVMATVTAGVVEALEEVLPVQRNDVTPRQVDELRDNLCRLGETAGSWERQESG